jgi:hypothetical protein
MRKGILLSLVFLLIVSGLKAQLVPIDINKESEFLLYLNGAEQQEDFDNYGDKLLLREGLTAGQKDTLSYVIGITNYQRKRFEKSAFHLSTVSDSSVFFMKSYFYKAISFSELKDYKKSFGLLDEYDFSSMGNDINSLKIHEQSGVALLMRDYVAFDTLSKSFNATDTSLQSEHRLQLQYAEKLKTLKRKSPVVAGALSAVIPGLGLVYSGNNGQALSSFIRVAAMGALSIESLSKLGPTHPQFIAFASLFSFFYIGNIWGSALSVQIRQNEQTKELDHNIMVGLHIPVDKLFQ